MKSFATALPALFSFLLVASPVRLNAELNPKVQESTVRIICPAPAKNGGKGFAVTRFKLSNGTIANDLSYSFGTGFVINNDGFIVTNNHVVATDPLTEVPSPLVMVMQRAGQRYILHKAKVYWQSPNGDLAIIQAPQLKATPLPLVFDETKSSPSEEVYSMGFPGITDVAEEDSERSLEITNELVLAQIYEQIEQFEKEKRRKLTPAEIEAIKNGAVENAEPFAADWSDLLAELDAFLKHADATAEAWDVTEVIAHRSLWSDYFKPTVTKGNIERIANIHGFLGTTHPDVLVIQHSCPIKHGNSGGPLLNAGGQVIGVVGRGKSHGRKEEREEVEWATGAGELKNWLEAHQVSYIPAGEWRKAPESPVKIIEQLPTNIIQQPTLKIVERLPGKIIAAVLLAVIVAILAAVFGLVKMRQQPSFTTILRDPRLARILGTTPSKLLAGDGVNRQQPPAAPLSGLGKWQLAGRTSNGHAVRIEMTDTMFGSHDYRLVLGRSAELCHVVVNDSSVSKQHAHIRKDGDRFLVADRNSSNRTAVNGRFNSQVFDEVPLKEGDTLTLGEVRLDFSKL